MRAQAHGDERGNNFYGCRPAQSPCIIYKERCVRNSDADYSSSQRRQMCHAAEKSSKAFHTFSHRAILHAALSPTSRTFTRIHRHSPTSHAHSIAYPFLPTFFAPSVIYSRDYCACVNSGTKMSTFLSWTPSRGVSIVSIIFAST